MVMTLMTDGGNQIDLKAWADSYGLSYPITQDNSGVYAAFENPPIPAQQLIGRGMEILLRNTRVSNDQIEEALD